VALFSVSGVWHVETVIADCNTARDRWLDYRKGKGAGQEEAAEPTRDKQKGRDNPDDDFSL